MCTPTVASSPLPCAHLPRHQARSCPYTCAVFVQRIASCAHTHSTPSIALRARSGRASVAVTAFCACAPISSNTRHRWRVRARANIHIHDHARTHADRRDASRIESRANCRGSSRIQLPHHSQFAFGRAIKLSVVIVVVFANDSRVFASRVRSPRVSGVEISSESVQACVFFV